MKRKIATYCFCLIMLLLSVSVFSKQKEPPTPHKNNDVGPPGLPIDGGLSYLFIAGVAYGVYAIRKRVKD